MNILKMSLPDIKKHSRSISIENFPEFIQILEMDKRKTVQNYAISLKKVFSKHQEELIRTEKLKFFEKKAYNKGYKFIAGIDEVGRGPLAGPVVSAAVILPEDFNVLNIKDSKKISSKKRDALYLEIQEHALGIGIGIVNSQTIDKINIFEATKISMEIAVNNLKIQPDYLFIDAVRCENIPIEQSSITKGDNISISIACASIIAKVTRDRLMEKYHVSFPQYGFSANKGYGTQEHIHAIKKYGPINIHRRSFLKNIIGS